ncbi:DUF6998 domain-containing protein [Microvirga alba]|uniref:DUF6998 domain-containing protein n=1 Tax=Microvirga alba TaxID=2791025 RepID=UPI00389932A2
MLAAKPPMLIQLPPAVRAIYAAVAELEAAYPGRKFTPDGHLVGSIGEVIAAETFGLELFPMSERGHDARDQEGRLVQVKLTGGRSVSLYYTCERLIVLRMVSTAEAEVVYDGPGEPVWNACGPMQKNGQRPISITKLRSLSATLASKTMRPQDAA